ncbi:MAG: undecaprenyl-phosphate glucose phosphotransferase [Muribaculaceae bacterium]|nr:undecaprenyl-phosphate glucose phosphotransferase [Muribaculaceae bacterium]
MNSPVRPNRGRYIPTLFNIGDIAIVNLLFWFTLCLFPEMTTDASSLRELWLSVNVAYIPAIIMGYLRPHNVRVILMEDVMRKTFIAVGLHALVFLSLSAFLHITTVPARAYITYYSLLVVTLMVFRVGGSYALKAYRRRGFNYTKVAIVGTGPTAMRLFDAMRADSGFGYNVMGFFDDTPEPGFCGRYVGDIDRLSSFVRDNDVRQIFFTLSGHHEAMTRVIKIADDNVADFYYVPQIPRTFSRRFELNSIGSMPVLTMQRNPLKNVMARALKRTFDIVFSGTFLLFYPLVYIPVAIAIKLSSPGPVYFRQERTGYRGRTFKCLKFRTMRVNATSDSAQATANDPRKTAVGDFLRRSSIDELPQFINVLKGDMSVVGPRPHMLKHTEQYTALVDHYMVRHAVKPGITGWAQVNGYRGITDELWKMERRVECDVWYIENWSFLLDIKIIVRTVINAVSGEKNAF